MSSNRLMALEDSLGAARSEQREEDSYGSVDDAASFAASTRWRPQKRPPQRALRAQAQALAAARPIQYRVAGRVPHVAAPGSLNAWASALTMLLSWRERASLGVEEAVARAGSQFGDLLRRNEGVPAAAKADLLAAAGLAANPPARLAPEDWEMLLREHGPLWVTDDERAGRLFSMKALVVVGIRGSGGSAELEAIDPVRGRAVAVRLDKLAGRLGERLQVVHVLASPGAGAGAANGALPVAAAPPPPFAAPPPAAPIAQSLDYSSAMNPAVIIAASGFGWTVLKDLAAMNASSDITYKLARLDGRKRPTDDASWDGRAPWTFRRTPVLGGPISVDYVVTTDVQNMTFDIEWQCNGHAIGPIVIRPLAPNDALEWKLYIEADITPRDDLTTTGANGRAAVEVVFRYEHRHLIYQNQVYEERIVLYADGTFRRTPRWIQSGYGFGMAAPRGQTTRSAAPVDPNPQVEEGVSPPLPLPAGAQSAAFASPPVQIPWFRGGRLDVNNHTTGDVTVRYRPFIDGSGPAWTDYGPAAPGTTLILGIPPLVAATRYEVLLVERARGKTLRSFIFEADPAVGVHGEIVR